MRKIIVYFLVLSIILSNNSIYYFANNINPYEDELEYEELIEEPMAENNYEYEEEKEEDLLNEIESKTTITNSETENFDIIDLETTFIEEEDLIFDDSEIYEYEEEPEEDEVIDEKINEEKKFYDEYDENIETEKNYEEFIDEEMVELDITKSEFESSDIEKEIEKDIISEDENFDNDNNNEETISENFEIELDSKNEIEEMEETNETEVESLEEQTESAEKQTEITEGQIESLEEQTESVEEQTETIETKESLILEETVVENELLKKEELNELIEKSGLLGASATKIPWSFSSADDYIKKGAANDGGSYELDEDSSGSFTVTMSDLEKNTKYQIKVPRVTIVSNQSGLTFSHWENNKGDKYYGGEILNDDALNIVLPDNKGKYRFTGKFTDNRKKITISINENNKVGNANLPTFNRGKISDNLFYTTSDLNIIGRKTKIVKEISGLVNENKNYSFKNITTSDGKAYNLTNWNAASNVELRANFDFIGYYVYFKTNSDARLDSNYIEKLKKGNKYVLPMPTFKAGKDQSLFRWQSAETNELFEPLTELTFNADDNLQYEPYFIEKNRVIFDMQNHGSSISDVEVEIGEKITRPTTPTAVGYKFVDWYKEQNFINKWNFDSDVIENATTTLYAKWNENVYDITYVENGGTYIEGYEKPINRLFSESKTYPNGEQIKKIGNNFLGWYENENFEGSPVTTVPKDTDSSKKLYALWKPKKYNVTLNINGGEFIESEITEYTYGTITNLPYNIKSPNISKNFVGWYEDSSFEGEKVSQITNTDIGDKTYYAKYGLVSLKLEFDPNGGDGNMPSNNYDYGSSIIIPDNPYSKKGYEFVSWIGSDGLNYNAHDEFNIYNDFILTANWKKIEDKNIEAVESETNVQRTFLWEEEKHRIWKAYDDKTKEYAKNQWLKLEYAGEIKWYHFNDSGYMDLGWIKDNGKYYYLQTDYNNTFGGMLTGVKNINGVYFHFADSGELINIIQ